jgi:hypothetical protein
VGLYSLLLASGEVYIADRVCRGDRLVELMMYHSPLNSVLMSSHVNRWERGDVSAREVSMITDNPNPALLLSLNNVVGGRFQSTILMRYVYVYIYIYIYICMYTFICIYVYTCLIHAILAGSYFLYC